MKFKLIALVLSTILLVGCGSNTDTPSTESGASTEPLSGEGTNAGTEETVEPYVLTFEASTIDGEELTSDCFTDCKLTMVNIWATYCNPCLSEMPALGQLASSYEASDFQIIGVISDISDQSTDEELETAAGLIAETQANYPHLLLNQSLYNHLVGAVDSVPTTFFINNKGEVLGYVIGAREKESWEAIIDELLAEL